VLGAGFGEETVFRGFFFERLGRLFGTLFAVTGRLWLPMVVHVAFDLTAVALIYWNWESAVAHFLFR